MMYVTQLAKAEPPFRLVDIQSTYSTGVINTLSIR